MVAPRGTLARLASPLSSKTEFWLKALDHDPRPG
jgi:hypothetical protein